MKCYFAVSTIPTEKIWYKGTVKSLCSGLIFQSTNREHEFRIEDIQKVEIEEEWFKFNGYDYNISKSAYDFIYAEVRVKKPDYEGVIFGNKPDAPALYRLLTTDNVFYDFDDEEELCSKIFEYMDSIRIGDDERFVLKSFPMLWRCINNNWELLEFKNTSYDRHSLNKGLANFIHLENKK